MFKHKIPIILFLLLLPFISIMNAQMRGSYLQLGRYELSRGHFPEAIEKLNIAIQVEPELYAGYYYRAIAKFQLDDYIGANEDYSKAILIYPLLEDLFFERAITRDKLFDIEGALQDYEKAIALNYLDTRIYINRAITFLTLNQYEAAIKDCNMAILLRLKDESVYIVRGAAKSGLTQYQDAIMDFNTAISKTPKNTYAYIQRGIAWASLSKKDSALRDFNYVLKLDSINGAALSQRAILEMEDSKFQEALTDFNTVIRHSPENASAYFNRAILKGNTNKLNEALDDYNKVLLFNPNNINALYNRGGLKYKMHDKKGALADFSKAIELFPDFADAYYNRSLIKKELNNIKGSMEDYKKSELLRHKTYSQNDSLNFHTGVRLMKLTALSNDFDNQNDAQVKIQNNHIDIQSQPLFYITLFPDGSKKIKVYDTKSKYYNEPITLINTSDSVDRKKVLRRINLQDSLINKNMKNVFAYINRAILYGSIENYNNAIADYNQAIAIDSTMAISYFSRANTYFKLIELMHSFDTETPQTTVNRNVQNNIPQQTNRNNSYNQVIEDYSKALKLDPDFTYAYFNRANVKMRNNDFSGAVDDFSKSLVADPMFSEAYFNRGLMLIFLQEVEKGCVDLSKAGELGMVESYNVMKRYCNK
jgi:tetratricopeptide (TPR) repeat protein